jgi:hypothetical protein
LKNSCIIRIYYFVAIILAGIYSTTIAKADPRLDLFVQKYNAMADKRLPLSHRDNPFSSYLGRHFEEGLDSKDRVELLRLQKNGDCWLIDRLLVKGFLQLYPFLKPAFIDETRGRKLSFMISSQYTAPDKYCFAQKMLNEIRARRNLADFAPIDMGLEIMLKQQRRRERKPETDRDFVSGIQLRLGDSAFCGDYPPSIKEVLANANKPGGVILTKDEELYLTQRARFHGLLEEGEYRQTLEKIRRGLLSHDHFNDILKASERSTLRKIEVVRGFWQPACKQFAE